MAGLAGHPEPGGFLAAPLKPRNSRVCPFCKVDAAPQGAKTVEGKTMFDKWAQRLIATAILIAAIALLIGQGTYAWKEITSLKPLAQAQQPQLPKRLNMRAPLRRVVS
jgi:hypothetical protein